LLGVTAHVSLDRPGTSGIKNYEEMATKLAEATGARSVTPAIYQTVLLSFAGQARAWSPKASIPTRARARALQRNHRRETGLSADADGIEALLIENNRREWKCLPAIT